MKKKFEELEVLKSEIIDAIQRSQELDKKLGTLKPEEINAETSEEELILVGYFLSGIYSTFEEIFSKVAKEFENKIEDPTQWHKELLNRMALDVERVRPAVVSKESKNYLEELRKFRSVFRYSYAFELDGEKLRLVAKRWRQGAKLIYKDMDRFTKQLDQLAN